MIFRYRYRKSHEQIETDTDRRGDPGLRQRLRVGEDGVHEAVLASLVACAVQWYRNKRVMGDPPASIAEATAAWRRSADLLLRYLDDRVIFDATAHVMSTELYQDFSDWLKDHGHVGWTDQNFTARLAQHPEVLAHPGVAKKRGVRKTVRLTLSRRPLRGGRRTDSGLVCGVAGYQVPHPR